MAQDQSKTETLAAVRSSDDDKYQTAIQELIRKHNLDCEELTANQLAVVIRQALASGDITKRVRVADNAQNIIYIPYAEAEQLRSRVRYLKELLKQNGIEENDNTPEPT